MNHLHCLIYNTKSLYLIIVDELTSLYLRLQLNISPVHIESCPQYRLISPDDNWWPVKQ